MNFLFVEMLAKHGIRLVENIFMGEMVRGKVYGFCLMAAPLKL